MNAFRHPPIPHEGNEGMGMDTYEISIGSQYTGLRRKKHTRERTSVKKGKFRVEQVYGKAKPSLR